MKGNYMKAVSNKKLLAMLLVSIFAAFALVIAGCSSEDETTEEPQEETAQQEEATNEDDAGEAVELQIFAANSLQKALPEVQELFTEEHPNVTFADTQFEASKTLVEKLASGGTADALICASTGTMDDAVEDGTVDEATRVDMFTNDLVVCVQEGSDLEINSLEDLATNDAIDSIAIGDPNTVPAGKYACQSLESAGLCKITEQDDGTIAVDWDPSIADKMNAGADKVGTVASYVAEGQTTVGLVYSSDIYRYDGIEIGYETDASSHKDITYPGAVCTSAKDAELAQEFIDFCMNNPDAQRVFSEYGFQLV